MAATKKTAKQTMLDTATVHLEWVEGSLDAGMPSDATLVLVNARVALATAWVLLARETAN